MSKELAIKITVDKKDAVVAFSEFTKFTLNNAKAISKKIMQEFRAAVPGFGGSVVNPDISAFREVSAGAKSAAEALEKAAKAMAAAALEVQNARNAKSVTKDVIDEAEKMSKVKKTRKRGTLDPNNLGGVKVTTFDTSGHTPASIAPIDTTFKESVNLFALAVKTFSASVGEIKHTPSGESHHKEAAAAAKEAAKVKKEAAAAAKKAAEGEVKDNEKILSLSKEIAKIKTKYTGKGAKKISQSLEKLMGEGEEKDKSGGEESRFSFGISIKKLAALHRKIENALIEIERASSMLSATAAPASIKTHMNEIITMARASLEPMIPTVSAMKSLQSRKIIREASSVTGIKAEDLSPLSITRVEALGKAMNALTKAQEVNENPSNKQIKLLMYFSELADKAGEKILPGLSAKLKEVNADLFEMLRQNMNKAGLNAGGAASQLGATSSRNQFTKSWGAIDAATRTLGLPESVRYFDRADWSMKYTKGDANKWAQENAASPAMIEKQVALVQQLQKEWGMTSAQMNKSGVSVGLFNRKQEELVSLIAKVKTNKQAYNEELVKENKLQSEYNALSERIARHISSKEGKYHTADDVKSMGLSVQALKEFEFEYKKLSAIAKDAGLTEVERERQKAIKISTQLIKDMDVAYKMAIKDGIDFQKVIADARSGTINKGGSNVDITDVSRHIKKYDQLAVTHPDLAEGVKKHFAEYRMDIEKTHTALSGFYATVKKYAAFQLSFYSGMALIFAAFNTIKSFVSAGMEFTQTMKDIQAVTGESAKGIEIVANAAQRVSRETPLAAKEIANMGLQFIRAGLDAQQASVAMDIAARVATVSGEDSKTVVDTLATSIMAWKKESSEIPQLGNAIAAALNYSRLTVTDLGTAFNFVGGIMSALKVPFNETMGVLASLSNMGVRASTMSTGMTAFLSGFIAPSQKLGATLENLRANMEKLDPMKIQGPNKFATILKELNRIGFSTAEAFGTMEVRAARFYEFLSAVGPKALIDMENKIAASTQLEQGVKTAMEGPIKAAQAAWNSMSITAIVVLQAIVPYIVLVANALNVMGGVVAHVLHLFTLWPALIGFVVGALFLLQKEIVALNIELALAGKTGIFASILSFFAMFIEVIPFVIKGTTSLRVAFNSLWMAISPSAGIGKILLALGAAWAADKLLFGNSKAEKDLKGFAAAATESQKSLDKYKKDFKAWNDDMEGEVSKTDPLFNKSLEILKKLGTPKGVRKEHELSVMTKEIKSYSISLSDAAKNAGISIEEMTKALDKASIKHKEARVNVNDLVIGVDRGTTASKELASTFLTFDTSKTLTFFGDIAERIDTWVVGVKAFIDQWLSGLDALSDKLTKIKGQTMSRGDIYKDISASGTFSPVKAQEYYSKLPNDVKDMLKRASTNNGLLKDDMSRISALEKEKPDTYIIFDILKSYGISSKQYKELDDNIARVTTISERVNILSKAIDFTTTTEGIANRKKAFESTLAKMPGLTVAALKEQLAVFDGYVKDYQDKVKLYQQNPAKNQMPKPEDLERKITNIQQLFARNLAGTGGTKFTDDFARIKEDLKNFELEQRHKIELRSAMLNAGEHLMRTDFGHKKAMYEEHFKGIDNLYKKDLLSVDSYYGHKRELMKNLSDLEVANIKDTWGKEVTALAESKVDLKTSLAKIYGKQNEAEKLLAQQKYGMSQSEIKTAETEIKGLTKDAEQVIQQLKINNISSQSADNKQTAAIIANTNKKLIDDINLARDESLAKIEQEARWEEKKYKMAIDTLTAKKDEAKLQGWGEAYAKAKEDLWKKEREHAIFKLENEIKIYELVIAQAAISGSGFKPGDAKYAEERIAELRKQIADKPTKYTEETFGSAAKRAIDEYLLKVEDMPKTFGKAVAGAMQDMQNAFSNFFDVNSANFMKFGKLAISVLNSIQKKLADMVAEQIMGSNGIGGLLKSLLPGVLSADVINANASIAAAGTLGSSLPTHTMPTYGLDLPQIHHLGGMIFHEGGLVPPLTGIRKYHTGGLAADERPAILQSGEYVVSRRGVKALDNINNGNVAQPNVNVSVNVTNQSSQPVEAKTSGASFNGREYVIGVVLQDIANNGPLKTVLKGVR